MPIDWTLLNQKPNIMRFLFVMSTLIIFQSCELDQSISSESPINSDVTDELSIHFENFEIEAAKRNLDINLSSLDLTAEIASIHEDNIAGTCSYSSHHGNHVVIDQEFWNQASFILREMVVFHELGHCVLAQGHREQTDAQGHCLSLMQSGTSGCRLLYNNTNRNYYLDELFFFED